MQEISPSLLPSVAALAFLGDSVHSAYIREMLVRRGISHAGELNRLSLHYVTAEEQARAFHRIEGILTEYERDLYRRAANSKHLSRPRHASLAEYRTATGFEAILGMHRFIGNEERIRELLSLSAVEDNVEENVEKSKLSPKGKGL